VQESSLHFLSICLVCHLSIDVLHFQKADNMIQKISSDYFYSLQLGFMNTHPLQHMLSMFQR